MENKNLVSADEIINMIKHGWKTKKEWEAVNQFIENAEMEEKELDKLRESGWLDAFVHA